MTPAERRISQPDTADTAMTPRSPSFRSSCSRPASLALSLLGLLAVCATSAAQSAGPEASPATIGQRGRSPTAVSSLVGSGSPTHTGASASTAKTKPESVSAQPKQTKAPAEALDRSTVISFLGELISWYRHLGVEERLATDPAETLFVAEDRQNARRVADLGFQYADAVAKILSFKEPPLAAGVTANSATGASNGAASNTSSLLAHKAAIQSATVAAGASVQRLKLALSRASKRKRDVIAQNSPPPRPSLHWHNRKSKRSTHY